MLEQFKSKLSFQVLCTIFSVLSQVCQSNWEWKTILKRIFSLPTSVFIAILFSILNITYCHVYCVPSGLRFHKTLPGTGALFAVFDESNYSMPTSHFACEYYNSVVSSKIMEHDIQYYVLHCSLSIDKIYCFSIQMWLSNFFSCHHSFVTIQRRNSLCDHKATFVHYSTGIVSCLFVVFFLKISCFGTFLQRALVYL